MRYAALIGATLGLVLASCAAHGPGGVAYDTFGDTQATGATTGGAGGSVSGAVPARSDKEPRGNTPPGQDRDGHGPAAGAILDPTGAATGTPSR